MPLPFSLWDWQAKELREHGFSLRRALFASPRLGKTATEAVGVRVVFDKKGVRRAVVVAPKKVVKTWERWLTAAGLDPLPGYNLSAAQLRERIRTPQYDSGVLILNEDMIAGAIEAVQRWKPGSFTVDESHRFASPSSARGRAMRALAYATPRVRLLTGTPVPNHYGNLWGQLVALNRDEWFKTYEEFKCRYLISDSMYRSRVFGHREDTVGELRSKLLRYATIVRREDVFGPDHWQVVDREVDLSPKVRELYDRLAKEWTLDEFGIETTNTLARMTRLQQIASGFLPKREWSDGETDANVSVLHTEKIDACLADLDEIIESGEKAVVFHRFRWEGTEVAERLRKLKVEVHEINGDSSIAHSDYAEQRIREAEDTVVVVMQIRSGIGTDYSEAAHAMMLSETYSFVDYEQARDRVFKPGRPRTVTRYIAKRTVDDFILNVLEGKQDIHMAIKNADHEELVYGSIRRKRSGL